LRRGLVRRRLALKLNVALLRDRGLLNCNHLAFHLSELGRVLFVTLDKECGWPEDDDGGSGRPLRLRALTILDAQLGILQTTASPSVQAQLKAFHLSTKTFSRRSLTCPETLR
jgi:hypothetical protein